MKWTWIVGLTLVGCSGSDDGERPGDTDVVDTGAPSTDLADVLINEFMASNVSTLSDEAGAFPDWVELFNASAEDADLSGWWLTDDASNPFVWQIPDGISIPAGQTVVVFADNDPEEGDLHASFQLDAQGGEDLALFGPNVLDNPEIDRLEGFGVQQSDVSLARMPDGGASWEADATPTPGASNN